MKLVYTISMLAKILISIGLIALAVLAYMLNTTTPSSSGVVGVLVVFLSFYIACAVLMTFFIYWLNRLVVYLFFADVAQYKSNRLSLKKAYYFGSVLAIGPVVLISMQSIGSGGIGSFAMVCVLLGLISIYISRQTT